MKQVVFYSWQSDLPAPENKNFILDAIKRALKSINKSDLSQLELSLDKDTEGQYGAPSITESIFSKISNSNIFIADVTIINASALGKERPTPNPNVLFELGYAVAQLGWEKVILVQNTDYGNPEDLPFDLRGRRISTYSFMKNQNTKSTIKSNLQSIFEASFKDLFDFPKYKEIDAGNDIPLWFGKWNDLNNGKGMQGNLNIYDTSSSGFLFTIDVSNGAHLGNVNGYAKIFSNNFAVARLKTDWQPEESGLPCEITFRRKIKDGSHYIDIVEERNCSYFHGFNVSFNGTYKHEFEPLFEYGFLNEIMINRLHKILGDYYSNFSTCFGVFYDHPNNDQFKATVITTAPRGLAREREAIIMASDSGALWVAFFDYEKEDNEEELIIRYFTTEFEYKMKLPITIIEWCKDFDMRKIRCYPTTLFNPSNI